MPSNWDGVPWFVGGGAEHGVEIVRLVSYAAMGGKEGVVGSKDLEVREATSPGATVRVFAGACGIENRAAGAKYEMYAGRLPTTDTVSIASTGGGGGRHDLIVARVENPWSEPEAWDEPVDPTVGPYIFTRVISNVPSGTKTVTELDLGYSAIPLARIDIPVSTSIITQDMITDLRVMSSVQQAHNRVIIEPEDDENLTSADYTNWPNEAVVTLDVPPWATHVSALALLGGIRFGETGTGPWNAAGALRIQLANGGDVIYSGGTRYNVETASGFDRDIFMAGGSNLPIPAARRGQPIVVRIEGKRTTGDTKLRSGAISTVSIDVEWLQAPESNE